MDENGGIFVIDTYVHAHNYAAYVFVMQCVIRCNYNPQLLAILALHATFTKAHRYPKMESKFVYFLAL